ncbi:IS21 family transposase [Geobacillus thermoleovorans]|uniref:IS21 family transposase n=2 Tax=Geobacillus TaxID=129337 RepID=UPI0010FCF670|nr:IS21 family transposase [Geobacillus thermoleovorans]TLS33626.1 IS21 family transposase [Geobacillus thermoleovorans]
MLAMPEINRIRKLREKKGLSIAEISRETGYNWRTVKKYADGDISVQPTIKRKKGMIEEEGYGQIIDDWLEEDAKLPRKQRRTNKTMFEALCRDHGFQGSYRTVCAYVQKRRPQLKLEKEQRYERLEHPPGEAQVDFGKMTVVTKEGKEEERSVLIMSFPYSNAAFAYPLPVENSECFLHGLTQLFRQAGGVPKALRIDNLSAAIVSIRKGGERRFTEAFEKFQLYYRFDVQVCNPYSGHEKGNAERKVYYTRNLCFIPAPLMESDPELVEWLHRKMVEDRNRPHYEKGRWIEELWQEEQPELLALPEQDLPIFSLDHAYVNKYGEVMVDGKAFVVHGLSVPNRVLVKKEWNRFVVFSSDGDVHLEAPRPYTNVKREIPWKEIFAEWETKPRVVGHSRYRTYLPEAIRTYLAGPPPQVVARLKGLRALLDRHTLYEIAQWLEESQRWDLAPHEIGVLMEAKHSYYPDKWEESYTPSVLIDYETDLTVYDQRLHPAREGGVQR